MKVDFYRHGLGAADAEAVAGVIASPFLTTGRVAKAVEAQLCDYFNVPHAVLVSSWTSGAMAALMAMEIGPGDEVIVPAMTFIATANVVEILGATAVMVDCDPATLLITPDAIADAVTARTKAVIPVHLYGQMIDIAGVRRALDAKAPGQRIYILEDCAHCFEGRYKGDRPGTHSDAASFSFYATKNVTCGEGGAVVFKDEPLYRRTLETRLHGMSAIAVDRFAGGKYNHWDMQRLGIKANLPDLLAALLPEQIKTIDARLPARLEIAARYRTALAGSPFRLVEPVADNVDASHLFVLGVPGGKRDEAIARLNAAGVGVTVNYRALPEVTYYRSKYPDAEARNPHAMLWGRETISLPHFPGLTTAEQDHVIKVLLTDIAPTLLE